MIQNHSGDGTARPTIRDVARQAGVSTMTVSRALNEPASVRPRTLAAVERAVHELDYVPNLAAKELARARQPRGSETPGAHQPVSQGDME